MKLLFFIHSLGGGGAERVTATLASHWAERGWIVSVVTLASKGHDQYPIDPAVHRIGFDLAAESSGPLAALLANGRRIRALRGVLRSERPDVAVSMMSTANVLLACAGAGLRGIRLIGSERTYPPEVPIGRPWEWLRARTYGWLEAVVAPTGEIGDWLAARTSARRVEVIPNPVIWPLLAHAPILRPESVGSLRRRRLLTVGRLGPEKQYDLLIDVFAQLTSRFPNWELVILGEGPERAALQARIDALGLGGKVMLPGQAGNVTDWYGQAALYVLTSRFEGFPNGLVEAMAHGLPAVSFDCDTGPRDIIRSEVDGLLVPPGDKPGLVAALARVMGDETLRLKLGARAVEIRTRFSLESVSEMWCRLFPEVIS